VNLSPEGRAGSTIIIPNSRRDSVRTLPGPDPPTLPDGISPSRGGEPVVPYAKTPGIVEVHLSNPAALFDRSAVPSYPHTGPMVNASVASFLVRSARVRRGGPQLEVAITFDSPPMPPAEEAATRAQLSNFFANEAELVELDLHVNRKEGLASVWYALPLVILAGVVAGIFYVQLNESPKGLVLDLVYLLFITIVWVMLWDPIEVLLFDSFFIRQKHQALRRLSQANVRFAYGSMTSEVRTA